MITRNAGVCGQSQSLYKRHTYMFIENTQQNESAVSDFVGSKIVAIAD